MHTSTMHELSTTQELAHKLSTWRLQPYHYYHSSRRLDKAALCCQRLSYLISWLFLETFDMLPKRSLSTGTPSGLGLVFW